MNIIFSNYDHISNPYYSGGGAHAIHEVAKRLAKKNAVTVFSGKFPGSKDQIIDGVSYKHIGWAKAGPLFGQIAYQLVLPFYYLKSQSDVWFESFTPPWSTAFLPLFSKKKKVIGIAHNLAAKNMQKKYHLPFAWLERFGLKQYRHIIALTQDTQQELQQHTQAEIHLIPNAVDDIIEVNEISIEKKYIFFLGRVDIEQKGLDLLIKAFAQIKDEITENLYIAGHGVKKDITALRELITHYDLEDRVKLIGKIEGEKKSLILKNASFVVFPSRFESQGITFLEALSHRKAIICFDIEGLKWLQSDEAIKVKPFSIKGLAKAMLLLSSQPKMVQAMEKKLTDYPSAHLHTWDTIGLLYDKLTTKIHNTTSQKYTAPPQIFQAFSRVLSNRILQSVGIILFIAFLSTVLLLSLRGKPGNPTIQELNQLEWKDEGPLELSPERGRFALLYSIIEEGSVEYSLPVAKFTTPDLGYVNEKFVSLFAPGVSFLLMPGYIIGKSLGFSQIGTYGMVAFFGLINALLIKKISDTLHFHPMAGIIAGMTFLFGTPAFAYAVSLYQHHISTFLILSSVYLVLRWKNWYTLALVWFLCAASIPIDYPNAFLMMPIGFYALGRIFSIKEKLQQFELQVKLLPLLTFAGVLLPLAFFMWFNKTSYDNPLQFSGTILQIQSFDKNDNPLRFDGTKANEPVPIELQNNNNQEKRSAVAFFQTRNMLNGFHTHFTSIDRGTWFYTPIMLIGVIGILLYFTHNPSVTTLLVGIISMNILLYSMWGDPYGGWAFGSRYMIPGYAILSIFLAYILTVWRKNALVLLIVFMLSIYSIAINTMGALTTNRIPPKIEVLALEAQTYRQEKYTYGRNFDMLKSNQSKSMVYNTYLSQELTALEYYYAIVAGLGSLLVVCTILLYVYIPQEKKV